MYIEIHNHEEFSQKVLYFKLNNAFNMAINSELNHKIVGIYAIYKDDICLYVGQSKNLASRIATHLRGKYQNSTEVFLWNIEDIGFSNYLKRSSKSQQSILDSCEKWLMTKLKPVENITIDMNFKLSEDEAPNICFESDSSISINISDFCLKIFNEYCSLIEEVDAHIDGLNAYGKISNDTHHILCESIRDVQAVEFYMKMDLK